MLGECPEAEEVAQEVFVKFYLNIHKFRQDSGLKTYLTRIAINLSLNELKKRKRQRERFVNIETENKDIEDQGSPDDEFSELVDKALHSLEPHLRSVIVLRHIEGYDTRETADLLKIPQGTVLSRLHRGQQKLKEIIKKYL